MSFLIETYLDYIQDEDYERIREQGVPASTAGFISKLGGLAKTGAGAVGVMGGIMLANMIISN